jgi:hypothetical protein
MKKIITTLCLVFAICTFAVAQSTTSTANTTKATPTVNATDKMESKDAANCTPEMMKECKAGESGTKSCCSHAGAASSDNAGSTLGKEGDKAKTVTIGMSAKKPEKDDKE